MQGKFQIRRHACEAECGGACICWVVIAPNDQREHMANFRDAISMLDIWIEEYRCKIAGRQRMTMGVARA